MDEMLSRFDAAEYLEDELDAEAYLGVVAEEQDPQAMVAALATIARARNITAVARGSGISRAGLYKALSPTGNPSFVTISKVARALGLEVCIRRVGSGKRL